MALSLDRKAFIDIISEGEGDIGGVMQPPPEGIWGMPPEVLQQLPGYDPDVQKKPGPSYRCLRFVPTNQNEINQSLMREWHRGRALAHLPQGWSRIRGLPYPWHYLPSHVNTAEVNARGREAELPSDFSENALDLVDSSPIELGDLGNRHAVFGQGADARKLRSRDRARRRQFGADRNFELLGTHRCRRREYSQHTRFTRRLVGWRGVRNRWPADWRFRCKQRFGRLARSGDPLAIIAARVGLLLSAKQDLLRTLDPSRY
jgi:hypothetical protein